MVCRTLLTNLIADEFQFKVESQPKRQSDSGGKIVGGIVNEMSLKEGILFIMDILDWADRKVPAKCQEIIDHWREEMRWSRKSPKDLLAKIPAEDAGPQPKLT